MLNTHLATSAFGEPETFANASFARRMYSDTCYSKQILVLVAMEGSTEGKYLLRFLRFVSPLAKTRQGGRVGFAWSP